MDLSLEFWTPEQEAFYNVTLRNSMFSGGFGNGKTFGGCQKLVSLGATFANGRGAVVRYEESKLKHTTMVTFYKVCPPWLYDPKLGGNRADSLNYVKFINGTVIIFMNLKDVDEGMVRGLELDWCLIDQAEEISEKMWLMMSARVGRWDRSIVPKELIAQVPNWPKRRNGMYRVPNYLMGLCNPDSELHWIWRRFHPDSEEFQSKFHRNHVMIQGASTTATVDPETLEEMQSNDDAWVERFVRGKWGIPGGQIHLVPDECILTVGENDPKYVNVTPEWVEDLLGKAFLSRVLDHGDASPTCCLFFASYKGNYYCWQEYYRPNALISQHRVEIAGLSKGRRFLRNLIDPQCAKKTLQKYGGHWSHIEEYADPNLLSEELDANGKPIPCPIISWEPADNNEATTRNRISELLRISATNRHPVTGVMGAPRLYFIRRSPVLPYGVYHTISQLKAQKRKKIGEIEGKEIYSDERDENVPDHAYDCVRYYCADHANFPVLARPPAAPNSFKNMRRELAAWRNYGYSGLFGGREYLGSR